FLIFAAIYESWSLPFSVLLSTPVAVFGAFGVLWLRRTVLSAFYPAYMVQIENDVYSQIGLLMLIGLAAKNAILILAHGIERGRAVDRPLFVREQFPRPDELITQLCLHKQCLLFAAF